MACCVPLAITRLERNIFSGLFPASLISNYESETTRWAAASGSPLPSIRRSLHPPSSNGPFFVFSSLIQRLAQAVTCLDSPFFYPAPAVLPRENSSLRYFCTILLSFSSRFLALFHSFSFSSLSLQLCERNSARYVFMIDIYILLLYAEMTFCHIRFLTRDSNSYIILANLYFSTRHEKIKCLCMYI